MAAAPEKATVPGIGAMSKWDSMGEKDVKEVADKYNSFFDRSKGEEGIGERKANYTTVVNSYYDLVTDFYEYGWGQAFHFASRTAGQSFEESIVAHEKRLADFLRVGKDQHVLDVGCGVGGPMRAIARHTGARITGINNNAYQLARLDMHNRNGGLDRQCGGVKGDFMKMPFSEGTFDGAYSIEATCHAPDRKAIYSEIFRVLKPGATFALYEWCMTDKYDPTNAEHNEIKHGVEVGDALPPIMTCRETLQAFKDAGFDVVFDKDVVDNGPGMIPWYATLAGSYSLHGFRMTWLGRTMTHSMCRVMEFLRIAPQGTVAASQLLMNAADSLVASGVTGIFTPMYLMVGRKPLA
eukprot:m.221273 g.221273  ORF g.221273 m.221273 type:complete len:352 (-) comp15755_c0_seq1:620-1675(-)